MYKWGSMNVNYTNPSHWRGRHCPRQQAIFSLATFSSLNAKKNSLVCFMKYMCTTKHAVYPISLWPIFDAVNTSKYLMHLCILLESIMFFKTLKAYLLYPPSFVHILCLALYISKHAMKKIKLELVKCFDKHHNGSFKGFVLAFKGIKQIFIFYVVHL